MQPHSNATETDQCTDECCMCASLLAQVLHCNSTAISDGDGAASGEEDEEVSILVYGPQAAGPAAPMTQPPPSARRGGAGSPGRDGNLRFLDDDNAVKVMLASDEGDEGPHNLGLRHLTIHTTSQVT